MKTETTIIPCTNANLYADIYVPNIVPAPAVLICHGMDVQGFHYLRIYRQLAETACKNGFVSLVFDFRGVGKSTGEFDYGLAEQQDVRCALNYLASRQEVLPNRIFGVGHSLGGAVSLYAFRNESRIKGVVLWSTPKNHTYNVKKFVRRTRGRLGLYLFLFFSWLDKYIDVSKLFKMQVYGVQLKPRFVREKLMKIDESEAVTKLHDIPILVVVGDEDVIVGKDEARAIFERANEPRELLIVEGADHVFKGKEEELVANTVEWMKKWK
jgi:alpha/beta superfamily hydrolase